ncbi:hypothetical protein MSG28_009548 [Choristoneura fumiferana]|uniref:Uncharacterized protein n=1 Tax=Choristoneura fumiferana TaxID=7141 RepID=A0ACC0JBK8_CHOFU|nr:hypothetical protein MSG28_009548 [Choristoneura fumiferana]
MASTVIKCTTCNIVICELLAFIQNKVKVMNEQCLVKLCISTFSVTEIETAKSLLFDSLANKLKKIVRKNDGKSQRNLSDMIAIFKQTEEEDLPIFVARELHKLPPVTFDHIDATRLLKDMLILKNEINNMKDTYVTEQQLTELKGNTHRERARVVRGPATGVFAWRYMEAFTQNAGAGAGRARARARRPSSQTARGPSADRAERKWPVFVSRRRFDTRRLCQRMPRAIYGFTFARSVL